MRPQDLKQFFDKEKNGGPLSASTFNEELLWSETDSTRTLTVKIKMPKDQALDMKVEKRTIHLSGKIQTKNSLSQFSRIVPVPADCDPISVKMGVDKEGFAQMTFKKIHPSRPSTNQNQPKPKIFLTPKEETKPAPPSGEGLAI